MFDYITFYRNNVDLIRYYGGYDGALETLHNDPVLATQVALSAMRNLVPENHMAFQRQGGRD
jgi:hypothetical protein